MWKMVVTKGDEVIAERMYFRPSECTDRMLIAKDYYERKNMEAKISMYDKENRLIATLIVNS